MVMNDREWREKLMMGAHAYRLTYLSQSNVSPCILMV